MSQTLCYGAAAGVIHDVFLLDDIARASRDLDALRLAYQCIADECENDLHCGTDCAPAPGVLGQAQAQRCAQPGAARAAAWGPSG